MENELSCPLCNFQYCEERMPRILGMCGHTFCEQCIEMLIMAQDSKKFKIICPEDDAACELQSNSLKQFPVNKVLLKIIQSNRSKSSIKDSSLDVSKIVKQEQMQDDEETKQLIIAIKQGKQWEPEIPQKQENTQSSTTYFQNSTNHTMCKKELDLKKEAQQQSEDQDNICLLHQKPLEIVCIVDLQKICAKCAIFGKHKGHDFKSIEQIEEQNEKFYQQLLAIYEHKTSMINRFEKKQTKKDLLAILNVNKQNISKQVKQRFKKLIEMIKIQQKKALTKLDKILQKIQKQIDDLYNIDSALVEKYEEWEKNSFDKMKIIQSGTFQEKLSLILVDQANINNNLLIQGRVLINEIKLQQDQIFNKAEILLSNMKMKSNEKIFEFVENYVEVTDKQLEIEQKTDQSSLNQKCKTLNLNKKNIQDDLLQLDESANYQTNKASMQQLKSYEPRSPINQEAQFDAHITNNSFDSKVGLRQQNQIESRNNILPPFYPDQFMKNGEMAQQDVNAQRSSKQNSFISQKMTKPNKKKLKSIKISQKYEKVLDSLYSNSLQTFDLTNAELGDGVILQICEFIPGTKLKTVKFIRNKLTDDGVIKMLPYLSNITTLNLSQNLLTQRVLDILSQNIELLPKIKNIILSLNKINERKHKNKIDLLRKLDITVSV